MQPNDIDLLHFMEHFYIKNRIWHLYTKYNNRDMRYPRISNQITPDDVSALFH